MSDKIIHDMMEDIIDDLVEQGNTGSYPYILDKGDFGMASRRGKDGNENIADRDDALGEIAHR